MELGKLIGVHPVAPVRVREAFSLVTSSSNKSPAEYVGKVGVILIELATVLIESCRELPDPIVTGKQGLDRSFDSGTGQ